MGRLFREKLQLIGVEVVEEIKYFDQSVLELSLVVQATRRLWVSLQASVDVDRYNTRGEFFLTDTCQKGLRRPLISKFTGLKRLIKRRIKEDYSI